jgi:hypothetical protein
VSGVFALSQLVSVTNGEPILPQHAAILRKRSESGVSVTGLVATIIGVLITAVGVFRWKCLRGRREIRRVESCILSTRSVADWTRRIRIILF